MNVNDLFVEVSKDEDGIVADNPEYSVLAEIESCEEGGEKETFIVVAARWDHDRQVLILETGD